jgi:hypothetical protein
MIRVIVPGWRELSIFSALKSEGDPNKAPEEKEMTEMKHSFATALLTAASLMAPTAASAQSKEQATIPFDFTVGQRLLPAGTYVIDHVEPNVISVRGWKGNELLSALTLITPTSEVRKNPHTLIFHKYGDQYFLSEIRGELGDSAGTVGTSKLEKRFQLQQGALANQNNTVIALK